MKYPTLHGTIQLTNETPSFLCSCYNLMPARPDNYAKHPILTNILHISVSSYVHSLLSQSVLISHNFLLHFSLLLSSTSIHFHTGFFYITFFNRNNIQSTYSIFYTNKHSTIKLLTHSTIINNNLKWTNRT